MADQPKFVDVTFYAVIEPKFRTGGGYWAQDAQGRQILEGARLANTTVRQPKASRNGVVTKLTLRVDAEALLPLLPEAVIEIGPGNSEVMHVVAEDPELDTEEDDEETGE